VPLAVTESTHRRADHQTFLGLYVTRSGNKKSQSNSGIAASLPLTVGHKVSTGYSWIPTFTPKTAPSLRRSAPRSNILHLHCSFVPCASGHCFPYDIVFQAFISYTGGQSVSHVLLWQPSECVYLIVMIVLCCFRKINNDDDDNTPIRRPTLLTPNGIQIQSAVFPRITHRTDGQNSVVE